MNLHLFQLNIRRGLAPLLGVALVLLAIFIDLGGELPAAVGLGSQSPGPLLRGLRRTDQWVGLLVLLLPFAILQACIVWRVLEQRERLWLLSSPVSKNSLCISTWAGAWTASLLWLLLAGGLCECSASRVGQAAQWRLQGGLEMGNLERQGDQGVLRFSAKIAPGSRDGRVRFSVGMYGLENQAQAFEFSCLRADGTRFDSNAVEPALRSTMEVAVPAAGGQVEFEFRARGAQRELILHAPQLDHFVPGSGLDPSLALMGRMALLLAVVQALVLGLGAWFSAPTVLLYVVGSYSLLWLEADRLANSWVVEWIPGADLPCALSWIAAGRGPSPLPLPSLAGACLLVACGLGLLRVGLGRWRAGR